jgi:hypothetical protein
MIGESLFSKEGESAPEAPSEDTSLGDIPSGEAAPSEIPEAAAPSATEVAPAPFAGKALPKAWKKEMAPVWEKLPPEAHEYVYQREADIMRGLQQYQTGHQQWNEVIQPFRHVMEQHPDVNPAQLLGNLMTNHLSVVQAPKAQKIALISNIVRGYGLDISDFMGETSPQGQAPLPEVQQLQGELYQIKQSLLKQQEDTYNKAVAAETTRVNAFFEDPKNEFASEVSDDILRLLKTGTADSLEAAYDQACWLNPVVRQKILAKQQVPSTPPKVPTNIESTGDAKPRSRKPKDWQSGVDQIIHKHYG